MGGVESGFQLASFKIDSVVLNVFPSKQIIENQGHIPASDWDVKYRFRTPMHFKEDDSYLCGVEVKVTLPFPDGMKPEEGYYAEPESGLINLTAGITGSIKVVERGVPPETVKQIISIQVPTVLLPFLRGMVTSVLANEGFGSFIFPLVNMHKLAEQHSGQSQIKEVEKITSSN